MCVFYPAVLPLQYKSLYLSVVMTHLSSSTKSNNQLPSMSSLTQKQNNHSVDRDTNFYSTGGWFTGGSEGWEDSLKGGVRAVLKVWGTGVVSRLLGLTVALPYHLYAEGPLDICDRWSYNDR